MTTILDRSLAGRVCSNWPGRVAALVGAFMLLTGLLPAADAFAKTPGSTYCFHGTCHRVRSIAETGSMIGRTENLMTSFYDDCRRDSYNPCGLTSSGEAFRADKPDNAASPVYPDGTTLLVFNPATKKAAVVRVNNAGPYWGNRKLDLSRSAAEKLGFKHKGVAKLQVKVLKAPTKAEATYSRNRKYAPVAGYVGNFASVDAVTDSLTAVAALKAATSAMLAPMSKQSKLTAMAALDLNLPTLTGNTGPKPQLRDTVPKSDTTVAQKRKRIRSAARS